MLHLGDITKISGYDAPIVDCIIGGSPCQDLSIAGKRAGLDGERSGLFMHQIRIVKEMRGRYVRTFGGSNQSIRPRHMLWENVNGAFSSNGGEDFRIVLEETAKIVDKNASIPRPPKGKWTTSGCILGDGWSIAWRVLDAQFYGVPQRRRRIALVADFGGHSAPEILFVRKSVSGYFDESKPKREETATDAAGGVGTDDCTGIDGYNGCLTLGVSSTLGVNCGMSTGRNAVITLLMDAFQHHGWRESNTCGTLTAGQNNSVRGDTPLVCYTMKIRGGCEGGGKGALIQTEKSATLSTLQDQTLFQPVHFTKQRRAQSNTDFETWKESGIANTLNVYDIGDIRTTECVVYENHSQDSRYKELDGICETVSAKYGTGGNNQPLVVSVPKNRYIVRRLTPLECERLQGFPDGWTDIGEYIDSNGKKKQSSDAARYKALGNSIAIPPWKWVLKRLCAYYERDATMASLFDGIGGFPYIWEQLNGKGTCLWASEIEEFPIAVTKARIGGD